MDDSIKNFQTENNAVIENLRNTINTKLTKGSLPAGIPDAKGIYDLLEKGYGGQLDENLLYLNDQGVKQKDFLYFDRNKPGLFRCIQTTSADYVTNSTTYFVDASPASNADRLTNLNKKYLLEKQIVSDKWYEKYSDGTLIQGINNAQFTGMGTINNFLIPFANTNYNAQSSILTNNKDVFIRFYDLTNKSIGIASNNQISGNASLIVFGTWK